MVAIDTRIHRNEAACTGHTKGPLMSITGQIWSQIYSSSSSSLSPLHRDLRLHPPSHFMGSLGQWFVVQHCDRKLHLTWSRKCMVEQVDYFHYLTRLPYKNGGKSLFLLTAVSDRLKYDQACLIFPPSRIFLTKKPAADMLHRNGWGFFKHTTEFYLYLPIQMFSLICWTKSTPKEVPSLHQTFHFAEKLMTHLRFSPLEKISVLDFAFFVNKPKRKSLWALQEGCRKTAEELLQSEKSKENLQEELFGKASTKPVKLTLGFTGVWVLWMRTSARLCVCRRWEPQPSIISACLMPSACLSFCHNSVV